MSVFRKKSAVDTYMDVLSREKRAVLSGNFDALQNVLRDKERLFARLPAVQLSAQELVQIQNISHSNNMLLAASAQGIKSAAKKLTALAETPATLRTYDPQGRQVSSSLEPEKLQRHV